VLTFLVLHFDIVFALLSAVLPAIAAMAMNADTIILFIMFDILCEINL
jgi:hypothetical protein